MKITQWRVSTFKLLTDAWSIYVCKKCVMKKRKSLLQYEKFDESIKRLKEDILLQIWLFSDIKVNQKTIKCPNITLQLWIFVIMTKTEFKNYTRQSGKYMWVQTSRQQWGIWGLEETLWKVENTHAHIYMYTLHIKHVCFGLYLQLSRHFNARRKLIISTIDVYVTPCNFRLLCFGLLQFHTNTCYAQRLE